jgi:hypothetical protein
MVAGRTEEIWGHVDLAWCKLIIPHYKECSLRVSQRASRGKGKVF